MSKHLETLAIHAGKRTDPATGAVTSPIHPSTTFERLPDGSFREPGGYSYSRSGNPNRTELEACLAALEGGEVALAFSSGSAAAGAVFRALRPGDHAVIPLEMYHGIRKLLHEVFVPWGLELTAVDSTDLDAVRAALRPETALMWIETPANPRLGITDIAAVTALAREVGAAVACDNTWTPPGMQPVFGLGVDLVLHATTKYLAGHSDVLGGAVIARVEGPLVERIRFVQQSEGAVPSPFDSWLTLRGIRTLPYRVRGQVENAGRIAAFLDAHPAVARVHYPGLPSHPGHELAKRQMTAFGAMLSFELAGGEDAAMATAANVQLITRATSLGGVETLIEHRASIEGPGTPTPASLLRMSVGLEHHEDLIGDLERALSAIA